MTLWWDNPTNKLKCQIKHIMDKERLKEVSYVMIETILRTLFTAGNKWK